MAIRQGNQGIVTNGLQLYYNREYVNSFRGEATTNIAYATNNNLNSGGNWWINSGTTIFNDNDTSLTKPIILNVDTTNLKIFSSTVTTTGNQQLGSSIISILASTQYTMTIYYWFSGTSMQSAPYLRTNVNNNSLGNFAYNGDTNYLNWPRKTWIRLSVTFTTQSNETGVYMSSYTGDNVGEKLAYFGYQLEQRSYATPLVLGARAIATTNLLTATYSTLPTNWNSDGSGQGSIGTYSLIDNGTAIRIVDVNSNTRLQPSANITGISGNTSYTFSVKYRKVSGSPTLRFQIGWNNSSNVSVGYAFPTTAQIGIVDMDGWQLANYTTTSPANTAKLQFFIQDGDDYTTYTHTYDLKEPQIQANLGASPWTATSYSANTLSGNGGLVDLSGNNRNVDLANISFDGSGYYFNGSSNYIDLGSDVVFKSSGGWSVSSWFNLTQVNSGTLYNFIGASAITYNSWYWTVYQSKLALWNISPGGWYYGSTTIQANTWYNAVLVCSYDGTKYQMYLNGVPEGGTHVAYTWNSDYSGLKIGYVGRGDSSNGRYFYGSYPIIQVYNKVLTSAEIARNFNSGRKAYGI